MNYKQGYFTPAHPEKYKGRVNAIIYRSGWELRFMKWCDSTPSVIEWSSEELVINYIFSYDRTPHRYFPDFKIKIIDKNGVIKTYIVEVKPLAQTKPPRKNSKNYLNESLTFIKNNDKWRYAREYCESRGYIFMVLTEKSLGI